jgi:two-component system LytT family sensor kinase
MQIQRLLQDKRYLFWALQFTGWGSWGITFYLGMLVWGKSLGTYAIYLPIVSTCGLLITLLLRALYHATWNSGIGWRVGAVLVGSYLAGAAWMASRVLVFKSLFPDDMAKKVEPGMEFWSHFEGTTSAFMVMVVWSALYFGIKFYMMAQEEQQRRLKATSMAHEAQLKMLHYQLNPHFLFNTLNAISTLILDEDTKLANTMVTRLSRFTRRVSRPFTPFIVGLTRLVDAPGQFTERLFFPANLFPIVCLKASVNHDFTGSRAAKSRDISSREKYHEKLCTEQHPVRRRIQSCRRLLN